MSLKWFVIKWRWKCDKLKCDKSNDFKGVLRARYKRYSKNIQSYYNKKYFQNTLKSFLKYFRNKPFSKQKT